MGSLRIAAAPDIYESKGCIGYFRTYDSNVRCFDFCTNQRWEQFPKAFTLRVSVFPSTCFNWSARNSCSSRSECILVHALEADDFASTRAPLEDEFQLGSKESEALKNGANILNNSTTKLVELRTKHHQKSIPRRKSKMKIWNRVDVMNRVAQRKVAKTFSVRKVGSSRYVRHGGGFEAILSTITPDSSTEQCNFILKFLERRNGEKAIHFFEWMKRNGKLKNNAGAYKLVLRVLACKEDWVGADLLLQEMSLTSECELDSETFNQLIYACTKKRIVAWGAKWFRLMLQSQVRPNASTIGMLMSLYQKTKNLSEAEFTFSCMRSSSLHCVNAYSAIITIYTRLGLHHKSQEIIDLMDQDGVLPNLENWLVRINAYSQQGKLEEAESTLKSMMDAGFMPNIVAYNTLITGYGRVSDTGAAEKKF